MKIEYLYPGLSYPNLEAHDMDRDRLEGGIWYRVSHPFVRELEKMMSSMEGGRCVLFSSGMSACACVLVALNPREVCLIGEVYNEVFDLAHELRRMSGMRIVEGVPRKESGRESRVVLCQSVDDAFRVLRPGQVREWSRFGKVIVDVTPTSPCGEKFLEHGATAVWASLSKYYSAGLVQGGALWTSDEALDWYIRGFSRRLLGSVMSPYYVPVLLASMHEARNRIERVTRTARKLVEFLRRRKVRCGWGGIGGVVGVFFDGRGHGDWFVNALQHFRISVHWGGEFPTAYYSGDLDVARLYVGFADTDALIADVDQALDAACYRVQ